MLQVNTIRQNQARIIERMKVRGLDVAEKISKIIQLDDKRKALQYEIDTDQGQIKKASAQIGRLMKTGKREEAESHKSTVAAHKESIKKNSDTLTTVKSELYDLLVSLPNVPHDSVPAGNTDEDNEVFKAWGDPLPELGADAKPHWELAKAYDIIDFDLGAKITGAGFPVFKGKGARLKRALINFFLTEAAEAGYLEIVPPLLVNETSAFSTGQLPDKEGQMYYVSEDDLYLIPTAEVPVTNIYRDVIVDSKDFPVKLTGYTPCFRREAGSYGSHVRGLNRVHQFDKVEIVQIVEPEKSYEVLQEMVLHIEGLLNKLGLPYRILRLCGGDLGYAAALTFDFEVFSAAQKRWLEVSSVSNFETFQSNRLKVRYKNADNKMTLVHTLNGSALALARIVACLMENHQTPEGIVVPECLRAHMRMDLIN